MLEFIVMIAGFLIVMIGLPLAPFLVRDRLRKRARKRRQAGFAEQLATSPAADFEIDVRPYREDLLRIHDIGRDLRYPLWQRLVLTALFGCWFFGGSILIYKLLAGIEPASPWAWLRAMLGVAVGGFGLWNLFIVPVLVRKGIRASSDFELSRDLHHRILIQFGGIRVHGDAGELELPWSDVDRVVVGEDGMRIMLSNQEFFWIPRQSMFQTGDWDGLTAFLAPLGSNR